MKKEILKGVLLTGLLSVMISCNSKKEETGTTAIDKEQIKKEIQAREDAFAEVFNGGIVKEIGYYADNAISFYPNRPPLIGRQAIISFFTSTVAPKSNKISFTTKDVFVSGDGNFVAETGYYKVIDSTNTAINTGNYISLFEKRDGKYVCVRDMSSSDMPVQ
ncbi:MAG TPA: nuclear transport factor 2 family protein [Agriterribacter sp.]|nr:nuclear transport factor 2 family protein [Agriterribacter sp.]